MTTIKLSNKSPNEFLHDLGSVWLPEIADLDVRLSSSPPARIADINCGTGWSSIGMAKAYLQVRVDGFDLDETSIKIAWANARREKLTDRVTFHTRDVGDGVLNGRYDLVIACDWSRSLSTPIGVLATMWRLAGDKGTILVVAQPTNDTLGRYALVAGFRKVEILPIKNCFYQIYRLHR